MAKNSSGLVASKIWSRDDPFFSFTAAAGGNTSTPQASTNKCGIMLLLNGVLLDPLYYCTIV